MPQPTYTILLFGESGAGKSTTINALANYLRFKSFDEAASGEFVKLIPSRITLLDPKTYEPMIIQDDVKSEEDRNEYHNENGYSVTQSPKHYDFDFGDKLVRIIDTPGMGDTGGLDVDKKNFRKILEHLKSFETLHGICFLIKTNATRKTAVFGYCLNQLLLHLPRSASKNIVFCFTFSRNSLYGPGDGFTTLKGFLTENELGSEKIELKTGQNCFFIDNEAFRFLLAKKYGYPFTEDKAAFYRESWDKSVEQTLNMIKQITELEPTKLAVTFTLERARKELKELEVYRKVIKAKIQDFQILIKHTNERLETLKTSKAKNKNKSINAAKKQHKIKQELVQEYESELSDIEEYMRACLRFVDENVNFNCQNLIQSFKDLKKKDENAVPKSTVTATTKQQNYNNSGKNTKRRKQENATGSPVANIPKVNSINENLPQKSQTIVKEISIEDFNQMPRKLISLKHFGEELRKIFGIEPISKPVAEIQISKINEPPESLPSKQTSSQVLKETKITNANNKKAIVSNASPVNRMQNGQKTSQKTQNPNSNNQRQPQTSAKGPISNHDAEIQISKVSEPPMKGPSENRPSKLTYSQAIKANKETKIANSNIEKPSSGNRMQNDASQFHTSQKIYNSNSNNQRLPKTVAAKPSGSPVPKKYTDNDTLKPSNVQRENVQTIQSQNKKSNLKTPLIKTQINFSPGLQEVLNNGEPINVPTDSKAAKFPKEPYLQSNLIFNDKNHYHILDPEQQVNPSSTKLQIKVNIPFQTVSNRSQNFASSFPSDTKSQLKDNNFGNKQNVFQQTAVLMDSKETEASKGIQSSVPKLTVERPTDFCAISVEPAQNDINEFPQNTASKHKKTEFFQEKPKDFDVEQGLEEPILQIRPESNLIDLNAQRLLTTNQDSGKAAESQISNNSKSEDRNNVSPVSKQGASKVSNNGQQMTSQQNESARKRQNQDKPKKSCWPL